MVDTERVDSDGLCSAMPSTFADAVRVCRDEITTPNDRENVAHILNRICYLGNGASRVYCLLALVKEPEGLSWVALLMVAEDGDVNNDLVPLAAWSVEHQLHACTFRTEFTALEPNAVETTDADGYTFRGPNTPVAQSSEPDRGKEADSFKLLPPRGNA